MKHGFDKSLREQLVQLLNGGHAHATFDDAVEGFPPELRGKKVKDLPYSAWMLLEHMRLAPAAVSVEEVAFVILNRQTFREEASHGIQVCHPERSEGSAFRVESAASA